MTNAEISKRPFVDITKLSKYTNLILESKSESLFSLKVLDPEAKLVEFYSTIPEMRLRDAEVGVFKGSFEDYQEQIYANKIIKDLRIGVVVGKNLIVSEPIVSCLIEGKNEGHKWSIEIFEGK